ncbi:hypothetical protein EDD18DRAFT_1102356 [Armillaria luteobubalina]|uniref:Uncharacterized protein n=1 Tax=Armillaria luteobubalina TaxID=153913 RepID=A0AA39URF9_9AGAR|nr:hypothetical protein EDD18DRAFT_1102356 [Armillaria luteobubalina]
MPEFNTLHITGVTQSTCFYSGWFWPIRTSTPSKLRMLTWTDTHLRKGWHDLPIRSFNSMSGRQGFAYSTDQESLTGHSSEVPPWLPHSMLHDLPNLLFGPSEASSSSPLLELEDAKNQVHSMDNPAQYGRLSPFSFKEWLQHVDENWGVHPRTWQEVREKDLADKVAAAHILVPNIAPLSFQDLFLR